MFIHIKKIKTIEKNDLDYNLKQLKRSLANKNKMNPIILLCTPRNILPLIVDHNEFFNNYGLVVVDEIDRLVPSLDSSDPVQIKKWKQHPPATFVALSFLGDLNV